MQCSLGHWGGGGQGGAGQGVEEEGERDRQPQAQARQYNAGQTQKEMKIIGTGEGTLFFSKT